MKTSITVCILTILAVISLIRSTAVAEDKPVKIYIFAGQSNMESRYPRTFLEENQPELVQKRNIWHVQGPARGPLAEFGSFGVDRAMVYRIAEEVDQPIIVFRCAVGGKTLYKDFRPPSAVKRAGGETGVLYKRLVTRFHNLVANLDEVYPAYQGQGYEIAGFVWFQGENDSCGSATIDGKSVGYWRFYEENLRDLIKDVRSDFGVPDMPVLIGQINVSDPWEMNKDVIIDASGGEKEVTAGQIVRDAQVRVAESTPQCEWVETKGLTRGYHYDAAAYVTIGQRMGEKMLPYARKVHPANPANIQLARKRYLAREFRDINPDTRSLSKGVICYFPLDEGTGTNVTDRSGKKLDGVLVTAQDKGETYSPLWVKGVRGHALKFMAGNHVTVPGYQDPTNDRGRIDRISMSYWINKTGQCGYGPHLARRTGRERGWWIDEIHNSTRPGIRFVTEKGLYTEGIREHTKGDGYQWHHIAIVFDGPSKRFDCYFNGRKCGIQKTAIEVEGERKVVDLRPTAWEILPADKDVSVRIGEQAWFGKMRGPNETQAIDEVVIWDRALTDEEISTLYNNGNGVSMLIK